MVLKVVHLFIRAQILFILIVYFYANIKMQQDEMKLIKKKFAKNRDKYYRDTIRIKFEHLHFDKLCSRERSDKIVKYLKNKFNHACLRLNSRHRISIVIKSQTLDVAIKFSLIITLNDLLDNLNEISSKLKLSSSYCFECFYDQ
jgi:hypothetical protein